MSVEARAVLALIAAIVFAIVVIEGLGVLALRDQPRPLDPIPTYLVRSEQP